MGIWNRKPRTPAQAKGPLDLNGRRLIGCHLETGAPIFAPKGHSQLISANGGGKTTCGLMPWLLSTVSMPNRPACLISDSKDGEIFAQAGPMLAEMGVPVALIDPMEIFPGHPLAVTLNPMGAVVQTHLRQREDLVFSTENANQALVPEPPNDARNQYWRDEQRSLIEFATLALLKRNPKLATPGGVWSIIGNVQTLRQVAEIEAEEGDAVLKPLALHVLAMLNHEHGPQHRAGALKALRIFGAGSRLHNCGVDATTTHFDLIRQRAGIFIVGPQAYMNRIGALYALHIMGFTEALYAGAGPCRMFLDEFTNAPLKPLVEALTTLRAYCGECHMISQSRSETERKFGKLETETIEENAITKLWFGFSSFAEACRVPKMMGEELHMQSSLSADNKEAKLGTQLQIGRQKVLSPGELMAMPGDQMLVHVKGVGFFVARKISQANLDPYCHLLAENPLEGGRLTPDPRFTLPLPTV